MAPRKRTKRRTKAERAVAEAERLARLLAEAPAASDGRLAPPAFIADPRLAPALRFWKEHAPQLEALGTLEAIDRFTFAMFCVYVAEFIAAEDDILTKGYSVLVKTVSGDRMPRENPSVDRRDLAAKMILEMSRMFGLSKVDRLNISKLARGTALEGTLFDPPTEPKTTKENESDGEWSRLLGCAIN